jgi:tRNA (guanine37-N1)-methyltransferase
MKFHVCTLFPEMIEQGCNTSILGRAKEKGLIEVGTTNIRDFSTNKHMKVDDYPYGGGAGMVMQAEPVYQACEHAKKLMGGNTRVIYLTPQGHTFSQKMAEDFAKEENLIFLCGHYEGIDERVLEEVVTDYVSIGDYVLTGGELPALVMIDAIARLVPEVLHNDVSADIETFYDDLLEYPQYSRPAVWHDKEVPEVLLSGHHAKIEAWRYEQSIARTAKWRPDLLEKHQKRRLEEQKQ